MGFGFLTELKRPFFVLAGFFLFACGCGLGHPAHVASLAGTATEVSFDLSMVACWRNVGPGRIEIALAPEATRMLMRATEEHWGVDLRIEIGRYTVLRRFSHRPIATGRFVTDPLPSFVLDEFNTRLNDRRMQ